MSEIKVNKISPRSGTTLTLGDSGDDFVIPAGATLTNNGTASGFASIAWQSSIVTGSTLTAVAGNGYWIDTTSNACTVTLPVQVLVLEINYIFRLCKNLGNKCNYNKYKWFKFSRKYFA
jgi:hypothetical protein